MPGAEKFVQLNTNVTAGKKIKVFESTDGFGNVVETQGVVIADSDGAEIAVAKEATLVAIQALLSAGLTVNATGVATESTLSDAVTILQSLLVELTQKTEPSDVQLVGATSLPLPTGASTEATLAAIKSKTDNLDVALSTRTKPADNQNVLVSNWPDGVEKVLYDTDDPSVFYIGTAPLGTAQSAAAWRIKRTAFDGSGNPLSTTWTGGTAVWDNRDTETYT